MTPPASAPVAEPVFYARYLRLPKLAGTIHILEAATQPRVIVNLNLAHSLLVAAEKQSWAFLNVRGVEPVREVELMVSAGLVDASLGNASSGPFAVINRVTKQGQAFLRAFKNQPPPRMEIAGALESAEH